MSTTRKQAGHFLAHTITTPALAVGAVVGPKGTATIFGVCPAAIAANSVGEIAISGVHQLAADADDAWADGDILYWDVADANLTDQADTGTNKRIGVAVGAKALYATTASVLLNTLPGPGAGF